MVQEERQKLLNQSKDLSNIIKESNELEGIYKKLLKEQKLIMLGVNPLDLKKKISDYEVERFMIEQMLNRPIGVEILRELNILSNAIKPNTNKNIALAGIAGLFAGIFLAFLMEYVQKIRE